jgi:hypothetical protein
VRKTTCEQWRTFVRAVMARSYAHHHLIARLHMHAQLQRLQRLTRIARNGDLLRIATELRCQHASNMFDKGLRVTPSLPIAVHADLAKCLVKLPQSV